MNESARYPAILVEKDYPTITLAFRPADALIQGLGYAEVFSIFDQVKTKGRACRTKAAKFMVTGAVVHHNQALHLLEELGDLIKDRASGSIGNYHGTDRLRCHCHGLL
jgi:hypothetical protein